MSLRKKIFKVLGVVVGIASVWGGLEVHSERQRISRYGATAVLELVDGYDRKKIKRGSQYTGDVSFETESGQRIKARASLPRYAVRDFDEDRSVRIYYNPDNPREFVFERDHTPIFMIVFGVGFIVFALFFL